MQAKLRTSPADSRRGGWDLSPTAPRNRGLLTPGINSEGPRILGTPGGSPGWPNFGRARPHPEETAEPTWTYELQNREVRHVAVCSCRFRLRSSRPRAERRQQVPGAAGLVTTSVPCAVAGNTALGEGDVRWEEREGHSGGQEARRARRGAESSAGDVGEGGGRGPRRGRESPGPAGRVCGSAGALRPPRTCLGVAVRDKSPRRGRVVNAVKAFGAVRPTSRGDGAGRQPGARRASEGARRRRRALCTDWF